MLYKSSGLRFVPRPTLQEWKSRLKIIKMLTDPAISGNVSAPPVFDLDDFNLVIIGDVLVPMLTPLDPVHDLLERRSRVGQTPTGASLTSLARETIPLKEEQRIVLEKVLSDVLVCAAHPYDHSPRNQTLLYIGREGGVGKNQMVKAIDVGMDLIHHKDKLILMAPTGAAANVIGGSTYHTSLGISLNRYQRTGVGARIRRLWARKPIMIIDEANLIDLSTLSLINRRCKITDLFRGLPVVILMGDFHQFPQVQAQPLWKPPRNETEQHGKLIWNQFKQVIILHEQMRQVEDLLYRNLLTRARTGTLSHDDMLTLNSKALASLADNLQDAKTAAKLNAL